MHKSILSILAVVLLIAWQQSARAGLLHISDLGMPSGGADCEVIRDHFKAILKDMKANVEGVIQYGIYGNTRPMFNINRTKSEIDDGHELYFLPDSPFERAFLECFSPDIKNPDTHEEARERIEKVEACVKKARCDLELPEVPAWLKPVITGLDASTNKARSKASSELLERVKQTNDQDALDKLSLELLAGLKTRKLRDEVAMSLEKALTQARNQHREGREKATTQHSKKGGSSEDTASHGEKNEVISERPKR